MLLKAKAVLQLTGDQPETWGIDCTVSPPMMSANGLEGAQVTIMMDRSVFEQMAKAELSPQQAFMSGKVKIEGNLGLSLKLGELLLS